MLGLNLLSLVAVVALSHAAPTSVKHVVHEKRASTPSDWRKGRRVESSAILSVRIGLTQTNLENGHDFLMDV